MEEEHDVRFGHDEMVAPESGAKQNAEGAVMKAPISCVIIFTITVCSSLEALSQSQRLVVLSPRVGTVVDSAEASTFK